MRIACEKSWLSVLAVVLACILAGIALAADPIENPNVQPMPRSGDPNDLRCDPAKPPYS